MSVLLEPTDLQHLAGVIAGLYQFSDGGLRGRVQLLHSAGLKDQASNLNLGGPAYLASFSLVEQLAYAAGASQGTQPLGALLREILTMGDLPQEDARFIATLIVKYSLVDDTEFVDMLRKRYLSAAVTENYRFPDRLTGLQMKQLNDALLSAFDLGSLRQLVRLDLDQDLDSIVDTRDSLSTIVFNLVSWAEMHATLPSLIAAALRENPGNPLLQAFVAQQPRAQGKP